MKFKHEDTITIPVPEQFQKAWQPIVYDWLQKNHQKVSLISLTIVVLTVNL